MIDAGCAARQGLKRLERSPSANARHDLKELTLRKIDINALSSVSRHADRVPDPVVAYAI
jgi:hypothetical protein